MRCMRMLEFSLGWDLQVRQKELSDRNILIKAYQDQKERNQDVKRTGS